MNIDIFMNFMGAFDNKMIGEGVRFQNCVEKLSYSPLICIAFLSYDPFQNILKDPDRYTVYVRVIYDLIIIFISEFHFIHCISRSKSQSQSQTFASSGYKSVTKAVSSS